MSPVPDVRDPRFAPTVELIGRTGAEEFQIRFSEEELPVVWVAAARWGEHWECAGAMDPVRAVFRLADTVIDGGKCTHCARPTGFTPDFDPMPMPEQICWYQWDPELATFRRGCE
jgi:hypothetical protein